ncbi:uncharacterized protein KY384_007631 [Bacidia gigantensis]|uniref:uncharacterized protein n=1 Tax=Bacidia gigantensis TaxID=2732470 RepID=UPI001D04CF6E|nr:uncharacterized protein KY384_007631 [Bacidia gigantensis]KAG8527479.1 hypothetical protein KY384_007631 [Bacidia gigantensis]
MDDDNNDNVKMGGRCEERSIYGASLKRKRIDFVPATSTTNVEEAQKPFRNLGDQYLSIVLKEGGSSTVARSGRFETSNTKRSLKLRSATVCDICNQPIEASEDSKAAPLECHDLSLAHQVCLQHSYPPSHLDRNRQGLKYLSSYGWDPDRRVGLGAAGEGIRAPVKVKVKKDTVGLGMKVPEGKQVIAPVSLDAGKVRKREELERRRGKRLQEMFYRNDDVEKYLGHD